MFESVVTNAFILVILFSGLPLLCTSALGFLLAVLQAATQIQEQSLSFLAKFMVLSLLVFFFFDFFSAEMLQFFTESLLSISLIDY